VHVTCEDPVRSKVGERIASALTAALEAKGYTTVALPSEADFLVRLVVRYLGRSTPPDGHADVVARASETILAGDAGWLASDGSGFDTEVRKPRGLHSRPKVRGFWGELFQGHEDDEWTLLVDLAVGTRSSDAPELVRRHDGRLWAQADAFALDRATATELLLTELEERLGESVP
jgi:hypothetical protein